jgi:hypothetical protein
VQLHTRPNFQRWRQFQTCASRWHTLITVQIDRFSAQQRPTMQDNEPDKPS